MTRTRGSVKAGVSAIAVGGLVAAGHAATGASPLVLGGVIGGLAAAWAAVRGR